MSIEQNAQEPKQEVSGSPKGAPNLDQDGSAEAAPPALRAPEDGGPAFPVLCQPRDGKACGAQVGASTFWHEGLSLRDYFYAKALPIANSEMENLSAETAAKILGIDKAAYTWLGHYPQVLARRALQIADAMLKARREA